MLACRPMLLLAATIMAGSLTERRYEPIAHYWLPATGIALLATAWFLFLAPAHTPDPPDSLADTLPDAYRPLIQPVPGFFARRGINRLMLLLALLAFFLGMARQFAWSEHLNHRRLPEQRYLNATLVADAPSHSHPGQTGPLSLAARIIAIAGERVPDIPVRLRCNESGAFRRGDLLHARIRVWNETPLPFPGAFNFSLLLERDGLAATVNALKRNRGSASALTVTPVDNPSFSVRVWRKIDATRSAAIQRTLAYGGEYGGLLAAMLFGYRQEVGAVIRDAFRRVGIGHVLAISGLHVGLIVSLLWWLGGWVGCAARWRAVLCLALTIFFWSLTGGQVASTRATVMAAIHLAGLVRGRRADMLNSLGAAALLITFRNPSAPLDLSFQLSFLAVVFIYMTLKNTPASAPTLNSPDPRHNGIRRRLAREGFSLLWLSAGTWIGLFPVIAFAFKQVNPAGLVINVVTIPLMSLVLAGGVLVPWLGWLPGMGWLLTLPARALTAMAGAVDGIPGTSFPVHPPDLGWVVLFYIAVAAWMMRPVIMDGRLRRLWTRYCRYAVAAGGLGILVSMRTLPPPEGGRIALLPGSGFGLIAAESPSGEIALIGTVRGGGVDGAVWLHSLHRRGKTAVLAIGGSSGRVFPELSWHYPLETVSRIPGTRKKDASMRTAWVGVPGVRGVEYACIRDGAGRMEWLTVRTGGVMVTVGGRMAGGRFAEYCGEGVLGSDAGLFSVYCSDGDVLEVGRSGVSGMVAVGGRGGGELPSGMFWRGGYGVLGVDGGGVFGFDGWRWVRLRSRER